MSSPKRARGGGYGAARSGGADEKGRAVRYERGIGSERTYSLADTREIAREWRKLAREGIDPAEERDKALREALTFEDAARKVWAAQIAPHAKNEKHKREWISSLDRFAFSVIGKQPVHTIAQSDVLRVLAPIWTERAETARRVKQRIGTVLDWARTAGRCDGINPVEGVEKGLPKQRRQTQHLAALPYDQLPDLMRRLQDVDTVPSAAVQFAILTAGRSGEVRPATWSEIELGAKVWRCPPRA